MSKESKSFELNNLVASQGARPNKTRVGRGIGSGKGKTCGGGHKGQKSRSGVAIKGFEGGQMPIHRRLPKRGFNNYNRKEFEVLNLSDIQRFVDAKRIDASKEITQDILVKSGILTGDKDGLKILGKGELKAKINISADKISESASKSIEKSGGKVSIIDPKERVYNKLSDRKVKVKADKK